MFDSVRPLTALAGLLPLAGGLTLLAPAPAAAQALFQAVDVDQSKFVIVAAPIGEGTRAQLNIYEQRSAARPCFAVQGSNPAVVDPLLSTFDFTGICNRFIDGNGYSLRLGKNDLGTVYRLSVVKQPGDTLLMALPTKPGAGPEMVVARSSGASNGFLLLVPEPGWKLMRRQFGGRSLGHVYVYRDSAPETAGAAPAAMSAPAVSPAPAASNATPAATATPAAPAVKAVTATPAPAPAARVAAPAAPVAPPKL